MSEAKQKLLVAVSFAMLGIIAVSGELMTTRAQDAGVTLSEVETLRGENLRLTADNLIGQMVALENEMFKTSERHRSAVATFNDWFAARCKEKGLKPEEYEWEPTKKLIVKRTAK